jgi:glycosyltransferase involved in cell wall biosynthesis
MRRLLVSLLYALGSRPDSPHLLIGGVGPRLFEPGSTSGVGPLEFARRLDAQVPRWLREKPSRGLARKLWKRRRARALRSAQRAVRRVQPDLYWEIAPVPGRAAWRSLPTIATVHDLVYLRDEPGLDDRDRALYGELHPGYIAGSRHVVAISEWTRQDVIERMGVPGERISVVPCGVGPEFQPLPSDCDREALRRRLRLPDRYLLHVGSFQPRKNLVRLVRAHAALVSRGHAVDLVLCGRTAWLADELFEEISKSSARDRIQVRHDIEDADLSSVYGLAELFVMPSLLEGFGIPVVEAMACGTPVVASSAGALPEVVGKAGVLVEPEDEWALAEAISELLEQPGARARLRARGFERASQLSWQASAHELLRVFRTVASQAG